MLDAGTFQEILRNLTTRIHNLEVREVPSALPSGTTAARPSASAIVPGSQFYDTTLSKPIWSDGTAWRDATGTAV